MRKPRNTNEPQNDNPKNQRKHKAEGLKSDPEVSDAGKETADAL